MDDSLTTHRTGCECSLATSAGGGSTSNIDKVAHSSHRPAAAPASPARFGSIKEEMMYNKDTDDEDDYDDDHNPVKDEIYEQDTDDDGESYNLPAASRCPPKVKYESISREVKNFAAKRSYELEATNVEKHKRSKRAKLAAIEIEQLECCNCLTSKKREKFSTKQWQRGTIQQGQRAKVYCRRCEEKILIRKRVGRKLEKHCVRIHTKMTRSSKPKYIATVIPTNAKYTFLPSELTLDGYTREPWSLEGSNYESAWQTETLGCLVCEGKMLGFLEFLKDRRTSAYGTFMLRDGTDGFFFVPFYQQPHESTLNNLAHTNDDCSSTTLVCKYILGLGLGCDTTKMGSQFDDIVCTPSKEDVSEGMEDYISSSMLGNLLQAQGKMESSLTLIPKGSVKPVPKVQPSPVRKKNMGYSRDWYGPKVRIKEGK